MGEHPKPSILVVDDEQVILQLFQRTLSKETYTVETAQSGQEALDKSAQTPYNLIITDFKMTGKSGVELLTEIKEKNPYTEVIIITGHPTIELAVQAIKIGATDFICKPFDIAKLRGVIARSLEKQRYVLKHIEVNELKKLHEIGETITSAASLDTLLERALEIALAITGSRRGWVMLRDEKTGAMNIAAKRELGVNAQGAPAAPAVREHSALFQDKPDVAADFSAELLACISLMSKGRQLGGINLADKIAGGAFTRRDQALLSVLASQVALAIENIKLTKQLAAQ